MSSHTKIMSERCLDSMVLSFIIGVTVDAVVRFLSLVVYFPIVTPYDLDIKARLSKIGMVLLIPVKQRTISKSCLLPTVSFNYRRTRPRDTMELPTFVPIIK